MSSFEIDEDWFKPNQKNRFFNELKNQDYQEEGDEEDIEEEKEEDELFEKKLNDIQNGELFFCDYITFQFQNQMDRSKFLVLLAQIFGPINTRSISFNEFDRYSSTTAKEVVEPGKKMEALLDYDLYKSNTFYLSFAGINGSKVYRNLFDPKILRFTKGDEKRIELKRLDFKTYLEVNNLWQEADESDFRCASFFNIQSSKPDHLQPPYLSLGLNLNTIASSNNFPSVNSQVNLDMITWTCSSTGWNMILASNNKLRKLRIYYKKPSNDLLIAGTIKKFKVRDCINLEVQFNKTISNKFTKYWKENNLKEFVKSSLEHYIKIMKDLPDSNINSLYNGFILPKLQNCLKIFQTQNFGRNSVITGINCIWLENQRIEKFYLENTTEFVSFLAIYISIINYANQELWQLETFKRIPFMSQKNVKVFNFSLPSLLFLVGWKDTPHLRLKMKRSLMALHTYKISSSPSNTEKDDKRSGFNCLITNLSMNNSTVQLSINMRVLVTLIEPISSIDLSLFSSILPEYNKEFKAYNKSKMTYPFYFYPLIAQILSSVNNHITYLGNSPTSGSAKLEFSSITKWVFSRLPQYTNQNAIDIQRSQKEDFITVKTTGGSFRYPNFNKKIHNRQG